MYTDVHVLCILRSKSGYDPLTLQLSHRLCMQWKDEPQRLFSLKKNSRVFLLPCCSSKETLIEQDMAERCLIDYCRAADKKERLLHVSYSDNEAFICCLVHRCGIVKLQENAWQTVSLPIFREKKNSEHAIYRNHTNKHRVLISQR